MKLSIPTLAVGALLAFPAASSAIIQFDKGIGGARVGNTPAQVRAALGKPGKTVNGSNDFGPFLEYRYAGLRVTFQGRQRVSGVTLTGPGDRTSKGAGIGTTEKRLKALHHNLRCQTFFGDRHCHTGRFVGGRIVTDFEVRKGKVFRVTVGRVID